MGHFEGMYQNMPGYDLIFSEVQFLIIANDWL